MTYTLNTTAPTGGTPVLTAASDSGTSHTDGITDVTAPTFTVALGSTVVAGDTVQLLLGGAALAHPVTHTVTAADISAGSVSLTVTAGDLGADGSKSITAQLSDSFGNSSTTAALTMTLDTTAPSGGTPALTAASNSGTSHTDGLTDVTAPTFTVALNPTVAAGDTVQLLLGGAALAHAVTHTVTAADISAGSISLAVTAGDLGADGSKSITAQFTDAAGNSSTTSADVITLDTTAPAKPPAAADAAVINGVVNAANDTASQALTGTAEGGSKVTIFDNGVQVGTTPAAANGSWTYVIGVLANGSSHSYTVMATDPAGNTSAPSNPLAFTVNTTAPAEPLAITAVAGSSLDNNTTITVSGTNGTLSSGEKFRSAATAAQPGSMPCGLPGAAELDRPGLALYELHLPGAHHRRDRKFQCRRNSGCNFRQCRCNCFAGGFAPLRCGICGDRRQPGAWLFGHHQYCERDLDRKRAGRHRR